ncbi:MAG: helix-turn-helix domain-containing protein [Candidatus Aenigmatarchaeota archaeon]
MALEGLEEIKEFLVSGGFDIFEYPRGCFDLAAKRERLMLLKILSNIDSLQRDQAEDLKTLSNFLDSNCFVLGKNTRKEKLDNSVIYERFGIPAMTPETFTSVVEGKYPDSFRTRGGTFGEIHPEKLKILRKRKDMTQKEVAGKLGVSQKSISEHESGKKRALMDMVCALEELFNEEVRKGVNPFEIEPKFERRGHGNKFCERLEDLGFRTSSIRRAPPKILGKNEITVLSRTVKKGVQDDLKSLGNFSRISEAEAFVITDEEITVEVPSLKEGELKEVENSQELVKVIKEKKHSA